MPVRNRMRISTCLLALVNMLPIVDPGVASEAGWRLMAIAVFTAAVGCVVYRHGHTRRVPGWVILPCVLGTVVYLLWEMFATHAEQTVYLLDLAHFLILLCCCKFLELSGDRDLGVVFLISFLLLVVAAFISAGWLFAGVVVFDLVIGAGLYMAFQARREMNLVAERRRATMSAAGPHHPLSEPEHNQLPPRTGLRTTGLCSLTLAAIACVTFVVIPRGWGREIFGGIQRMVPTSLSGFSREVRLDDESVLEHHAPVMRVRFFAGGSLITGEDFQPYMRGQTYDRYQHGRWRRTPALSPDIYFPEALNAPQAFTDLLRMLRPDKSIEQQVWLEETGNQILFSVYPPLTFGSVDIDGVLLNRGDFVLQAHELPRGRVHYIVHSTSELPPAAARQLERRVMVEGGGPYLIPDRIRALAQSLAARFGDPTDQQQHRHIAQGFSDHLRSGEYQYTLSRGRQADGIDPAEDFLFVNKRGHCQYFASAMTLLCHGVGIRARLVGGYHGGQFNPVGGYYQFRQNDAHTWVEVFSPQAGWETFDPTPASESQGRRFYAGLLDHGNRLIEFIGFKWSTLVVSYDSQTWDDLVARLTGWFGALMAEVQAGDDRPDSLGGALLALLWGPELFTTWQRIFYWLFLVLCITLALLALRVCWILSLMLREYISTGHHKAWGMIRRPEARFYDRLLLLLTNKGHLKPKHLTPREFARKLAGRYDDFAELPQFTEWFYQAQYGRQRLDPERWDKVKAFLQSLREDRSFGARRGST